MQKTNILEKRGFTQIPVASTLSIIMTPSGAILQNGSIQPSEPKGAGVCYHREKPTLSLPRARIKMPDADIVSRFERLGYKLAIDQIAFTTETVEDFFDARETLWTGIGTVKIYEEGGLLLVEKAQPRAGQPTRDVAVISLGHARAVMGVLKPDKSAELPRYAGRMESSDR
jgi:hypothetical protein